MLIKEGQMKGCLGLATKEMEWGGEVVEEDRKAFCAGRKRQLAKSGW